MTQIFFKGSSSQYTSVLLFPLVQETVTHARTQRGDQSSLWPCWLLNFFYCLPQESTAVVQGWDPVWSTEVAGGGDASGLR